MPFVAPSTYSASPVGAQRKFARKRRLSFRVRATVSATFESTGEPPDAALSRIHPPFPSSRERDSLPVGMPRNPADALESADHVGEDLFGRRAVEPGEIDGRNHARGILQRWPDHEK